MNDEFYMRLALQMAEACTGQTGINPVVGCVLVKNGKIIGMGAHLQRGSHHAEINALQMAGQEAQGSTAYVTLEPCSHHGRTPPCSDRLIVEKVARVVVACTDPNPQVAGKGIARLRSNGIEVKVGVLEQEALRLNERFFKFIQNNMPFVTLKTACTLDGKIASRTGDSKWITGEASRAYVHTLRHQHQAIMVGVDTILADDPQLTTRTPAEGQHPLRVIVDSRLRLPLDSRVVQDTTAKTLLLTTKQASIEQIMRLNAHGVEVLKCGDGPQVDLKLAMKLLGEREIGSILLEGGGRLNGAMLEARLIDKILLFYAPKIIGGLQAPSNFTLGGAELMADALELDRVDVARFGDDVCISGYPRYPEPEAEASESEEE
ncbi:bifunctional diaminohydroxyphosphoribosylaminopyrimidine deaminase/5-amino-6-(5-phosphoribosylamino)uracil reductase RibD [Paenibacillus sp. y28]|uniref:bifunctional diaminohydroxyphosphoribosylaminopyrimidine deaminase/5-amino-6-(5-phosphoribosylamino)uracil reductase RibD n=1 Tax=Paenibacillus sp. y28 TaxID=3129110 RepID=UPI003019DDDE